MRILFLKNFIEVQLMYNVVLSLEYGRVIQTHTDAHTHFLTFFPFTVYHGVGVQLPVPCAVGLAVYPPWI